MASFVIEEITDRLDEVWPEVGPIFEEQAEFHRELLSLKRVPNWRQLMRERIRTGEDALILVARVDGRAAGILNGGVTRNPNLTEETFLYIDNIHVRPEARRLGVARALVERAEEWSRVRGIEELQLTVVAPNAIGISAWEATGFKTWNHRMFKTIGPKP